MDGKVIWKQRMSFTGSASRSFTVPIGTSVAGGGDDDGLSPMELVLVALAGCTAMDVVSVLQKKRQDITACEVIAHGERADAHPRVYTDIDVEYVITGHNVDPSAVERAVELSTTKYCSVQAMLEKSVKITHKITIQEQE